MQYHAIIFAGNTKDAIIEGTVQLHPLPTTVSAFHIISPILRMCTKHNRFNYKHLDNDGLHLRILRKPVPWRGIMLQRKHGKSYSELSNSQHCHQPSISWNKGLNWQDSITQLLGWSRVTLLSSARSKRKWSTMVVELWEHSIKKRSYFMCIPVPLTQRRWLASCNKDTPKPYLSYHLTLAFQGHSYVSRTR